MSTEQQDASCETQLDKAREAWKRIQRNECFADWLLIGVVLREAQADAMRAAKTNMPKGTRYNAEIGPFLKENGFDAIDKGARSRLVKDVMPNRIAIETWLATVEPKKRLKLNHPQTVFSAWKRATAPPKEEEEESKPSSELCGIWKSATAEDRRAALDDGGLAHLLEALSPGLRTEIENKLANQHAVNRLAEKDAKQKQVVEAAKKETDKRAPKLGNATAYNEPKKAKRTKAKTAKPKNIGQWRKFPREKLQAVYGQERQRMETEHLNVRELKRLEEMRERLVAFEKTDTAVARQGNGGDPTEEARQRMADCAKRFAEAPDAPVLGF